MPIDVIRDENNPSNEYILEKDDKGNQRLRQVPVGTSNVLKTRAAAVSSTRTVAFAGWDELVGIKKASTTIVKSLTSDDTISFKPPHTQETKILLGNMIEGDPYIKRIVNFYTDYTFGERKPKPFLTPLQTDPPKTKQDNDDQVLKIISKTEFEGFKKLVATIDFHSSVYDHMKTTIWPQSYGFGTAAMWKSLALKETIDVKRNIRIPIGTPVRLKPIDGFHLTYIHQDVDSFGPKFYQYGNANVNLTKVTAENGEIFDEISLRPNTKFVDQNNLLPFDRLLIVRRPNMGITPNTWCYGVSPLLAVLYISENVRRIDEKILPELNEGSYAGVGIFTVQEDSKYDIDQLAEDLSQAGTRVVLNEGITYQPVQLDVNMEAILNQKVNLIKSEMMSLGVPESIFFPTNTNRSILEIIINIWQNIDLQKERDLLRNVMWNHWYKDIMKVFFEGEELIDLSLIVDLGFINKSFAGFVDKAAPAIEGYKSGILSKPEARMKMDESAYAEIEDTPPQLEIEQKKTDILQQQVDVQKDQVKIQKKQADTQAKQQQSNVGQLGNVSGATAKPKSKNTGIQTSAEKTNSNTKVTSNTSRSRR